MARRQVFTVKIYDQGSIGQESKECVAETRAFSVNASRGAAETLVRTLARETGERFTRRPYTRKVTETKTTYSVREDWVGDCGRMIFTHVEGML